MIDESQLTAVGRATVYSSDGEKIGKVGQIYLDDETGRPEWVSVNTGLLGLNESLVPLRDATLTDDRLEVAYSKDKVKDAPNVEADSHLDETEEDELYRYYGLSYGSGDVDAGRTGVTGDWTGEQADEAALSSGTSQWSEGETTDTPVSRGASDFTAPTGAVTDERVPESRTDEYATDRATTADTSATSGTRDWTTGASGRSTGTTDDAMTRSEEELQVGTEKVERGRARLRKYVTTEEETVTVPVAREEVRVEREPVTEGNADKAFSGPDISEDEHEVVLTEERPVVTTEAKPVERVRLEKETVTDEQRVSGDVRKEHIEVDGEPEARR